MITTSNYREATKSLIPESKVASMSSGITSSVSKTAFSQTSSINKTSSVTNSNTNST